MRLLVSGAIDPALEAELASLIDPRSIIRVSNRTLQFELASMPEATKRAAVAKRCASATLDHWFDDQNRRLSDFGVLAMDMDSTLITIECIDELAALAGKSEDVSRITEATMRGDIKDFAASLKARTSLLKGAPASILDTVFNERLRLTEGAAALISAALKRGLKTVVVSGGFTFFAERLRSRLGLDFALANELEVAGGRLTGEVLGAIVDGNAKARFVADIAQRHRADKNRILVIGDGANDIPMMNIAGMSVAFHAKPIVKSVATCGIDHAGLDVLLDWLGESPPPVALGH